MALFAIAMDEPKPTLVAGLKAACPTHYSFSDRTLVIRHTGGIRALIESCDLPDAERSGFVAVQINANYFGYSTGAFWDWLATAFREDAGG